MGWFFGRKKRADSLWDSMSSVSHMISGFKREGEAVSPRRQAGIIYRHDDGVPFLASLSDHLNAILYVGPDATKTAFELHDDEHGMRWAILNDGNFDDLLSSIFTVSNAIKINDGGPNLLAAVFELDFASHAVNPRRTNTLRAEDAQVVVALIIGKDDDDVGQFAACCAARLQHAGEA